ncbi:hypothetical protein GCM10010302_66740 [Streptomyces polychromogenes]|uniref:Uncharacterized protein n=1 Tax=Streptomyces polychromogenes TaxID=67342 RepID=A0ABP3FJN4_9ACTN
MAGGKRVGRQQLADLGFQGPALFVDGRERAGQGRDDHVEGAGARDDDSLFVERVEDVVDEPGGHARGLRADQFDESAAAGFPQGGRGSVAFQQPGDGLVVKAGTQDALQAGVELGEQAAYPVGGAGGLGGEVLVEAREDGELGGDLVGQFQGAQGVRHGAGGVRDHGRVLRVGLRLARVEVGDPPHRQSGQVGDLVEHRPQFRLAAGQGLVEDLLPGRVSPWPWCVLLPTSKPRKPPTPLVSITVPPLTRCRAGLGVGAVLAHPRYADLPPANGRALRPARRRSDFSSAFPTAPLGTGDSTSRSSDREGATVMPGPEASGPLAGPRKT